MDLHTLRKQSASISPSMHVTAPGTRDNLTSKLHSYFEERDLPYGPQDHLFTLPLFTYGQKNQSVLRYQHLNSLHTRLGAFVHCLRLVLQSAD